MLAGGDVVRCAVRVQAECASCPRVIRGIPRSVLKRPKRSLLRLKAKHFLRSGQRCYCVCVRVWLCIVYTAAGPARKAIQFEYALQASLSFSLLYFPSFYRREMNQRGWSRVDGNLEKDSYRGGR